ncbi:MAG: methylenetetrahydrofolate reductase C-terminal domain-containing protein [Anaerolineales bacterium]|jgi:hypothetical protein
MSETGHSSKIGVFLRNHPLLLERAYQITSWIIQRLRPIFERISYERSNRWLNPFEEFFKKIIFDCRMCGQCILHSTGMTCPMTCPKFIRNGPCGGVRENGNCEVIPEMRCVWVEAYERSLQMEVFGKEITELQPPVNQRLTGSSAWINMLTGTDKISPPGWVAVSEIDVLSDS